MLSLAANSCKCACNLQYTKTAFIFLIAKIATRVAAFPLFLWCCFCFLHLWLCLCFYTLLHIVFISLIFVIFIGDSYLSASVHKILIHGPAIIRSCLVPIGELSEEAAEARNKDIKSFRRKHTRKISRVLTNTDLFNRLLLSSDPFISGQRKLPCKQKSKLLKSVIELLDENIE